MKDNREEIKITTCSGLLARAILSAAENEEATRKGIAEAADRGFKRAVWEMCVEAVEEIHMLILERENPGIVRTVGA